MFTPNPGLTKGGLAVLDKFSKLTQGTEEGKGPWDRVKDSQESFDYVILGGGSAGCVLANRLAEEPGVKVLVLEAGESDEVLTSKTPAVFMMKFDTDADWTFRTTPQAHAGGRKMQQPRGKILGGTSAMNAMMYHRGPASDYDDWEALGNPGWSYRECLPFFKKSEGFNDPNLPPSHPKGPLTNRVRKAQYETFEPEYHGTDGPWQITYHHLFGSTEGFIRANIAEGVPFNKDFNGKSTMGVNRLQTFIQRDAVRSSLSRAFLKSKEVVPGGGPRGRIRVVYKAHISKILVHTRKGVKMAYGVEFVDHTNTLRRVLAAREVLLCAGSFGSPHLLLASGIGPLPQPTIPHVHSLAGVGRNLSDHLGLSLIFRARDRCPTMHQEVVPIFAPGAMFRYLTQGTGAFSSQASEAANFVRLEDIAPDFVTREKAAGTWQDRTSGPHAPHLEIIFVPYYVRSHAAILAPDGKSYYMLIALLLNPCSAGTVTIAPAKRAQGDTRLKNAANAFETVIDPNYLAESFDVRVLAEAVRFMRRIGRRLYQDPEVGGREVFPGEVALPDTDEEGLQKYAREAVETYYHPTSTCRMGPASDPLAVVDARLNVHGIERLRVVDASVMPKIPAAHPCAPTVMIAEKAADMIKEDWQDPAAAAAPGSLARL